MLHAVADRRNRRRRRAAHNNNSEARDDGVTLTPKIIKFPEIPY